MNPTIGAASGVRATSWSAARRDRIPNATLKLKMYAAYVQNTCRVSGRSAASSARHPSARGIARLVSAMASWPTPATRSSISSTAVTILDAMATPWSATDRGLLFGRMYEDPAIELAAFPPGGRIFTIASAGCTAFALACRGESVTAVDLNAAQIAYVRARLAGSPPRRGLIDR